MLKNISFAFWPNCVLHHNFIIKCIFYSSVPETKMKAKQNVFLIKISRESLLMTLWCWRIPTRCYFQTPTGPHSRGSSQRDEEPKCSETGGCINATVEDETQSASPQSSWQTHKERKSKWLSFPFHLVEILTDWQPRSSHREDNGSFIQLTGKQRLDIPLELLTFLTQQKCGQMTKWHIRRLPAAAQSFNPEA